MTNQIPSQISCGAKVAMSSCGMPARPGTPGLEHEQDQKRDREAEQAGCLGESETEKCEGLYLALRCGVARDRVDQRREHIPDPDTGADQRNTGETGADHFSGSKVHLDFPFPKMSDASAGAARRADKDRSGSQKHRPAG